MAAADRFAALVAHLTGRPGVAGPAVDASSRTDRRAPDDDVIAGPRRRRRGFGADALTVHGSIFAMLRDGQLVLKLPADRVSRLITDGDGRPFDAGKGRPMKQWVVLTADNDDGTADATWRELAEEALRFVGG